MKSLFLIVNLLLSKLVKWLLFVYKLLILLIKIKEKYVINKNILTIKQLFVLWVYSYSFLGGRLLMRSWTVFFEEGFNSIENVMTNLNQSWNLPKISQVPRNNWISYCHKEITLISTLVLPSFSLLLSLFLSIYFSPLLLAVIDIWKHDKLDPVSCPDERKLRLINWFWTIWLHRP